MKNKLIISIIIIVTLFCGVLIYLFLNNSKTSVQHEITQTQAIEILKNKFTELNQYPSNNLPPKSIKTEKSNDGWYVAFIQEGSGVQIINAKCFFVKNIETISQIEYISQDNNIFGEFSPKQCKLIKKNNNTDNTQNPKCGLETCHGLDVVCGPNPAQMCTEMYQIGDKCLQHVKCGILNGKCEQIQSSQFIQCKSCVEKCIENNKEDVTKSFECESNCK